MKWKNFEGRIRLPSKFAEFMSKILHVRRLDHPEVSNLLCRIKGCRWLIRVYLDYSRACLLLCNE